MRAARWYEVLGDGWFAIHDQPYTSKSQSVSMVRDLSYYRNNFTLRKVWGVDVAVI